jgi:hypothetical protein
MSLVAYGDSDDGSSDSDGEETTSFPLKTSSVPSTSSSVLSSTSAEHVQETIHSTATASGDASSTNTGKRSSLSSLLPKPSNQDNATSIARSDFNAQSSTFDASHYDDEDEIIEVEEEYVPLSQIKKNKKTLNTEKNKAQKSVGSLFSRMPSPWSLGAGISLGRKNETIAEGEGHDKNRKGKQPVRIVAPTISQVIIIIISVIIVIPIFVLDIFPRF